MIDNQLLNQVWNELKNDQKLPVETKIEDLWKLFSDFAISEGNNSGPCTKIRDGFATLKSNHTNKQPVLNALTKSNLYLLKEIAKWVETL